MSTELSQEEMLGNYPDVLLTDDICELLHVCRQTVYKLVSDGKLKTISDGRIHKFPKLFVREYMMSNPQVQNKK